MILDTKTALATETSIIYVQPNSSTDTRVWLKILQKRSWGKPQCFSLFIFGSIFQGAIWEIPHFFGGAPDTSLHKSSQFQATGEVRVEEALRDLRFARVRVRLSRASSASVGPRYTQPGGRGGGQRDGRGNTRHK